MLFPQQERIRGIDNGQDRFQERAERFLLGEVGKTIEKLLAFTDENGYRFAGKHHEIYLSDPRRAAPEKLKTIIREPVAKR